MKPQLLESLKREYSSVDGCYQPRGGPCYYIASDPAADDHGAQKGRHFIAHVESTDGSLERRIGFAFLVATMARVTKRHLIGDLDSFCSEVGQERFRERLDTDPLTEREDKLVLTRESEDSAFERPTSTIVIRRYQRLKEEILHRLADRHARGAKRVTAMEVLDGLCGDPALINRALNELTERGLIRDLNAPAGMRLTAAGQASAEAGLESGMSAVTERHQAAFSYDYFVSYASEDRAIAEQLHNALAKRGYRVWRDRGQLTLGDSLTAKIGEGLAGSRYGIVILSPAFLAKNWPQAELQALQARAIEKGEKVILPILRELSHEEMAQRLPLLADNSRYLSLTTSILSSRR